MARYTGPACRQCRREGKKLFLKGERCYSDKCALDRRAQAGRPTAPGQHGASRKKISEYGLQLRAKQSAKRFYGMQEGQFYKYFEMAEHKEGITGENLLRIAESRLDNIVYRLGFSSSRKEARQLVGHGHFTVNGNKVDIPSYLCKEGDVVSVADSSRQSDKIKAIMESCSARPVPMWLECDKAAFTGKVNRLPNREDIDIDVEEHLIVELYSK
ncbi:MAG: 30S ribosomal protein S4 [Oscillospiraceae bacterium]